MNKDIDQQFFYVDEIDKPKKLHEILQASKGNVISKISNIYYIFNTKKYFWIEKNSLMNYTKS